MLKSPLSLPSPPSHPLLLGLALALALALGRGGGLGVGSEEVLPRRVVAFGDKLDDAASLLDLLERHAGRELDVAGGVLDLAAAVGIVPLAEESMRVAERHAHALGGGGVLHGHRELLARVALAFPEGARRQQEDAAPALHGAREVAHLLEAQRGGLVLVGVGEELVRKHGALVE